MPKTLEKLLELFTIALVCNCRKNSNHVLDDYLLFLAHRFDFGEVDQLFKEPRRRQMKRQLAYKVKATAKLHDVLDQDTEETILQHICELLKCNIKYGQQGSFYSEDDKAPWIVIDEEEVEEEIRQRKLLNGKPPQRKMVTFPRDVGKRKNESTSTSAREEIPAKKGYNPKFYAKPLVPAAAAECSAPFSSMPYFPEAVESLNTPEPSEDGNIFDDEDPIFGESLDNSKTLDIYMGAQDFQVPDPVTPAVVPHLSRPSEEQIMRVQKVIGAMWQYIKVTNDMIPDERCSSNCTIHCLPKMKQIRGRKSKSVLPKFQK